ncbi:MAG TPA: hypothetical protein VEH27_18370 [Methylomirabilota bacterium]|nr:hypothetical protein [Methylomirabilota bacterium]
MGARISNGEVRQRTAKRLAGNEERITKTRVFAGLDGFVDEIIHVVDIRENAERYKRLATMAEFGARISEAAGKSTNIEVVSQRVKLGGNGPILANALAAFGFQVTYLGALGYPHLHPVFHALAKRAAVHSIADPGYTQALEFEDGKLMLGKTASLGEITWENIQRRFGAEEFAKAFLESELVAFVNWTMAPFMTSIWRRALAEYGTKLGATRRMMFFDLADPAKRTPADLLEALNVIREFQKHFDVALGLNEKEAVEVAEVFGIKREDDSQAALVQLGQRLFDKLGICHLVIHPVAYAFVVHGKGVDVAYGPQIEVALLTTGAGDHFNAGFCLGALLGFEPAESIALAVANSGYYVKNGATAAFSDMVAFLEQYPVAPEEEAA